jgi:hypothetical protein
MLPLESELIVPGSDRTTARRCGTATSVVSGKSAFVFEPGGGELGDLDGESPR